MPYVQQERRGCYVQLKQVPQTAGELNYLITSLINAYVREHGGVSYSNLNEVIGVLECAKQEFYRRVAVPVEDFKARANGDINWPTIDEVTARLEQEAS